MQGRRARPYAGIWTSPRTRQRAAERGRATSRSSCESLLRDASDVDPARLDDGRRRIAPDDEADARAALEPDAEPAELVRPCGRDRRAVVALHLDVTAERRRELAEQQHRSVVVLEVDVDLEILRAERQRAGGPWPGPGRRQRLEPRVGEELGELGVDTAPAERRPRVRGDLVGDGVDGTGDAPELVEQGISGVIGHRTVSPRRGRMRLR